MMNLPKLSESQVLIYQEPITRQKYEREIIDNIPVVKSVSNNNN